MRPGDKLVYRQHFLTHRIVAANNHKISRCQFLGRKSLPDLAFPPYKKIELAFIHEPVHINRATGANVQPHIRRGGLDGGHQPARHCNRTEIVHCQAKCMGRRRRVKRLRPQGCLNRLQGFADVAGELLCPVGRHHSIRCPDEKVVIQSAPQSSNRMTGGRLAETKTLGGSQYARLSIDGVEYPEQIQVKIIDVDVLHHDPFDLISMHT